MRLSWGEDRELISRGAPGAGAPPSRRGRPTVGTSTFPDHLHPVAPYAVPYDWTRIREALGIAPAMAAGLTQWDQPTGSRTYATFKLAGTEVMAELQAHDVEQPGERLQLHVDMNSAIPIDPQTELVL